MADQGKVLRPRRGSSTTMSTSPANAIVLASGEIFIEEDSTNGVFRIKIGDGVTAYSSLPYAFSGDSGDIKFNPGSSGMTSTNVEDAIIEAAQSGGGAGGGLCMGSCNTAADTAAKEVTVSAVQGFALTLGVTVIVKFTNTNTASNVTLNVNNTGAKSIYFNGAIFTNIAATVCGSANSVVIYTYDGTNWVWIGHGNDNNTAVTQTAVSNNANYEVLLSGTADNTTRTEGANKSSNITFNPSTGNLQITKLNGTDVGNNPSFEKAWSGSQAEYDLIPEKDPSTNYYII